MIPIQLNMRKAPALKATETDSRKGWYLFGDDNLFPEKLWDMYTKCPLLQSVVDGIVDYVAGSGFEDEFQNETAVNLRGMTLEELVKKCTSDYILFGAASVQVLHNSLGNISEVYYHDVRKVRRGDDTVYYSKDWSKNLKRTPYPMNSNEADSSFFYFQSPMSRTIYGTPMYAAAYNDILTSIEISKFHLDNVINGFTPAAVVTVCSGEPLEEEKKEYQRKFEERFTGTDNASRIIMLFADDETHAAKIEKLGDDNFDSKYQSLSKDTKNNIYAAFRAQPQLFGTDPERTGFNSTEFRESFRIFKTTVIAPIQRDIERFFRSIKEKDGSSKFDFKLKEFEINFD